MILVFFLLFCLAVLGVCYLVVQRRSLAPFLLVVSITGNLFRENKVFMVWLTGAISLHFAGTIILGGVRYNTTGFTIITHTMFGFFMRELFERADRAYPFIDKIRSRLPGWGRKYVTPSTLAFAFSGVNAIQEEIWNLISPGMWPTRLIHVADQLADVVTDITGILISLRKEWFVQAFDRLYDRVSIRNRGD